MIEFDASAVNSGLQETIKESARPDGEGNVSFRSIRRECQRMGLRFEISLFSHTLAHLLSTSECHVVARWPNHPRSGCTCKKQQ